MSAIRNEFGHKRVARAVEIVRELASRGLLTRDVDTVRLSPQGRLLSNEVFQQFLEAPSRIVAPATR